MNSIRIKIFLLIIFFISSLSSAEQIEELKEEERATLLENRTEITIKCNTLHADVFINGVYQGKTKLTLRNMQEGLYKLRLEKRGFKPKEYIIAVENETAKRFYIELEAKNKSKNAETGEQSQAQPQSTEPPNQETAEQLPPEQEPTEGQEVQQNGEALQNSSVQDSEQSTKGETPWWKRWLFNE